LDFLAVATATPSKIRLPDERLCPALSGIVVHLEGGFLTAQ